MSADLLALLENDPAAGILAVADLREKLAKAATPGPWLQAPDTHAGQVWIQRTKAKRYSLGTPDMEPLFAVRGHGDENYEQREADATFIVAEANTDHSLAAVRRWNGAVTRHYRDNDRPVCGHDQRSWPCPDLTETADEARAYLGGTA
jgi:hypothetical protein